MAATSVLVVDDEVAICDVIARCLLRFGYSVVKTTDGASAIRSFKDNPASLVMLDMNLPDMRGEDVLAALLAINPSATVVCMSGESYEVEQIRPAGFDKARLSFLLKPFNISDIRAAIDVASSSASQ